MTEFRIPLADWVDIFLAWLETTFAGLFDAIRSALLTAYDGLEGLLQLPPFWLVILIFMGIAYWAKGWRMTVFVALGFTLVYGVDQWDNTMSTLSLVLVATFVAVLISIPLGIWAAKSDRVSMIVRPIMDFFQTMPAMVYLIPALAIFRIGVVPGIVATIVFAMVPGVRLTELGIRGVDKEVVEAGHAFGATPGRILRQIQLPLAMPTIIAGINQIIMLALSMVVIAGMVGAGGLGGDVVASLNRIDPGFGFEAGISVVVLAIFLDRVTQGFATAKSRK